MFWMETGVLTVAVTPTLPILLPALDWDPTELAGEGIGERGDGTPVLLAVHGEGAWATLEVLLKCSLRVREYFITVSFLHRNIAMFKRDWQRKHKTANIFSCAGIVLSEKHFSDITYLMRSTVSEYTVYADLAELSDSVAIPHSIKDRTASKYLKAFPALSTIVSALHFSFLASFM